MAKRRVSADRRTRRKNGQAAIYIAIVVTFVGGMGALMYDAFASNPTLDSETLCPAEPTSTTVLLVDVTDPMNLPQSQDFRNQFNKLRISIPRHGKLVVVKVDPVSNQLLRPIIVRCNPGTSADVSEWTSDKAGVQRTWEEEYAAPLDDAFDKIVAASGAQTSPILESIQSVALTELQPTPGEPRPRTLVVASDLLQHTAKINFYETLPDPEALIRSQAFGKVATDLSGVDVKLWMLQRDDFRQTQPLALPELWERMITAQGGQWKSLYRVSG